MTWPLLTALAIEALVAFLAYLLGRYLERRRWTLTVELMDHTTKVAVSERDNAESALRMVLAAHEDEAKRQRARRDWS